MLTLDDALLILAALLVLAIIPVTWAVRLAPRLVAAEPVEHMWCGACRREQSAAMHDDGSHTCRACGTTTAGDQ